MLQYKGIRITVTNLVVLLLLGCTEGNNFQILDNSNFRHYIDDFNQKDNELYAQYVPNESAFDFLSMNIPLIDVPDKEIEETYYFRWWTYRKHLKKTQDGFVITEFLPPVPWAKMHNTINCPAGHHIYEGRWLRNSKFVQEYIDFWLNKSGDGIRQYSFWVADAALAFHKVHQNDSLLSNNLPLLVSNYGKWEQKRRDSTNVLFWQYDAQEGMEISVSGRLLNNGIAIGSMPAIRPSMNSYMYGDAKAISKIAEVTNNKLIAKKFETKAKAIKQEVQHRLWNKELDFFTVLPRA